MHRNEVPMDDDYVNYDMFIEAVNEARMIRHKEYQKTKEEGLTIRDRFALASISFFLELYDDDHKAVRKAYDLADAALEVRNESI